MADKPLSKSGREIRKQAQQKASDAVAKLTELMNGEGPESVRLAAIKELLDLGYGKFPPAVSVKDGEDLMEVYRDLKRRLDAKLDRLARRRKP